MIYITEPVQLHIDEPTVIMLGKFDGVHRGHQTLVNKTVEMAGDSAIPVAFIMDNAEERILTREERKNLLGESGIEIICEMALTDDFKSQSPEMFIKSLVDNFHPKAVIVGENFRFGCRRTGNTRTLKELGIDYGFETIVMPIVSDDGIRVSSTLIRQKLAEGDMAAVNRYLGYPFFVSGKIVHGRKLGHTIGVPTTNLLPGKEKLLPPKGVYVAKVEIDGKIYGGMTNLGVKPTVEGGFVGIETYIFDFNEDVYDKDEKVSLFYHTRPESNYGSLEGLKNQLEKDKKEVREYLISLDADQ